MTELVRKLQGELEAVAFVEIWWDDEEALETATESSEMAEAWEDVANSTKTSGTFWLTKEHASIPPPICGPGTLSKSAWIVEVNVRRPPAPDPEPSTW